MRVAGAAVFAELEEAAVALREAHSEVRSQAGELMSDCRALADERGRMIGELASYYIDRDLSGMAADLFPELRDDLARIAARRDRVQEATTDRLNRLLQERNKAHQVCEEARLTREKFARQAEELEQKAAELLAENVEFRQLSQEALQAEQQLAANEARAEELERDAAEKLPAYEDGELFQYLWRRGFGRTEYRSRGIIRALDRRVARLIDFQRVLRSYQFLSSAPELVRAEIRRRHTEFTSLMSTVESLQSAAESSVGLPVARRQLRASIEKLQQAEPELRQREELVREAEAEIAGLESEENIFYIEAVRTLRQHLAALNAELLSEIGTRTASSEDDHRIEEIAALGKTLRDLEPRLEAFELQRARVSQLEDDLAWVTRRFRQFNLSNERSSFPATFALNPLLDQFRNGQLTREQLIQALRDQHEMAPTWLEESAAGAIESTSEMLNHPTSRVLVGAMTKVAGAALYSTIERAAGRRRGPRPKWLD